MKYSKEDNNGFPIDDVAKVYSDAKGILPALNAENAIFSGSDMGSEYTITIAFTDATAAAAYATDYIAALGTAGFTVDDWWGLEIYVYEGASFFALVDVENTTVKLTLYPVSYLAF